MKGGKSFSMAILQFLHGKNLKTNNPAFNPGTMYLDTETGELWFDDPSSTLTNHTSWSIYHIYNIGTNGVDYFKPKVEKLRQKFKNLYGYNIYYVYLFKPKQFN